MTTAAPLLAARGAARRFGTRVALEPVELELRPGEALALVGPNGAGKSTLLAVLAGALEPTAGRIERRERVRVGWAPQQPAQYGKLSALENLELFARLEREADPRGAAEHLAAGFELPLEPRRSDVLSAGMRQRLNLAISLLGRPDVLLLDEPTAALDPRQRGLLWARTDELRAAGGAVAFATQNLDELGRAADRIAALQDGRLVFEGGRDEYERSLLAAR